MEYPPVAINEVLAFQFQWAGTAKHRPLPDTKRMFVEIVNTLTESGINLSRDGHAQRLRPRPEGLGLRGPARRRRRAAPTPITGQIPIQPAATHHELSPGGTPRAQDRGTTSITARRRPDHRLPRPAPTPSSRRSTRAPIGASNGSDRATNYYYVFGTAPARPLEATHGHDGTGPRSRRDHVHRQERAADGSVRST